MPSPTGPRLGARLAVDAELRRAAARFFNAAAAAGISAAPIKGLVVSAALYDDPLERPFGDVDVLVDFDDVSRVVALARRERFELVYDSKQLACVNVIVPPGIPFDVRGSVGPPGFAAMNAGSFLARARRCHDPRICDAEVWRLDGQDHLLVLIVDALMDKLAVKTATREGDLNRALAAWVDSPTSFADHARRAGLAAASHLVLQWLAVNTGNELAQRTVRALTPLPSLAGHVAAHLAGGGLSHHPHGLKNRIAIRLVADQPLRSVATLVLGLAGVCRYLGHNRGRKPWHGQLWRGPTTN